MTTSESYTLAEYGVIRGSDHASIPNADGNRDWRAYQQWLTDGNVPDPIPVVATSAGEIQRVADDRSARDKVSTAAALTAAETTALFGNT